MANFTDFNLTDAPADSDFIVGYKGDGSAEQRTTVNDLLSASLASKGVRFLGYQSIAIGNGNTANVNSLAIGDANAATGLDSLAQGDTNQATGEASFAQGTLNIAEGTDSQAQGYGNIASGINSHAQGYNNCTGGYVANGVTYGGAHAQGGYNVVAIPLAYAQGFANKIGFFESADWYAPNPPRLGFGYSGKTLSGLNVYGLNNPVLSSSVRLFFIGDNGISTYSAYVSCTQANYYDPYGQTTGFTIFLRNDASAVLPADDYFSPSIICVPITAYDGSTSFSNFGVAAYAQGLQNVATGNYAYAQGNSNTAQGYASHAAGYASSTGPNAAYAFAHGYNCTAYGRSSHAIGATAFAQHDNSYVWNSDPNLPGTFNSSASGQYSVNAPGGIVLSGGNTSVENLQVKNGGNITADWSAQPNYIQNLSASSVLGVGNSAIQFNIGYLTLLNLGNDINGGVNTINGSGNTVNGFGNAIFSHASQAHGWGNILTTQGGSVEGVNNIVGRPYSICKTVSAINTIYFNESLSPSSIILIESSASSLLGGGYGNKRTFFTVVSSNLSDKSVTVVEPLTALPSYVDGRPQGRYAINVNSYSTSANSNTLGNHVEGMYNYAFNRCNHVENRNNMTLGSFGHAEGEGNIAYTWSHAQGLETRAGMNVMFWDSYDADTKTFQMFTNAISGWNTINAADVVPGNVLYVTDSYGYNNTSSRRPYLRFVVLSADANLNTITALSSVYSSSVASNGLRQPQRQLLLTGSTYAHSEGQNTVAVGTGSHAEGVVSIAKGTYSRAAGSRGYAKHDYSSIWSSGDTRNDLIAGPICTTRDGQYMVSAHGGIFFPGKVGIGTDSIENALTVAGTISATIITADNISYNGAGFNTLPTYKTYQANLAAKNSAWPVISAAQLAETSYYDSNATYAMPGALIIKGHAPAYDNNIRNLPGYGTYGMWLQAVDQMDPGTTFVSDGRAMVTHAMSFRAGINNFTGGSDHNHVQWQGSPANSTQAWQMTNGGNWTNDVNTPTTNRFMVHTLPQYQISTNITATSGFLDTTNANYNSTNTSIITGVKLLVSYLEANNYNIIGAGDIIGLQINPGLVGLVAVTYQSQVVSVSSNNYNLSAYTVNMYSSPNNLNLAARGVINVNLKSRSDGGNPGVYKVISQIGSPSTNYVGLTGNYKNVPKHVLAKFTNAEVLSGLKPGAPLSFWVPDAMPSSLGTGFVSSTRQTTPGSYSYGYFDAFVKSISGNELIFSIGNLMDTFHFETRTWTATAAGNAGWILYGGSNDTVHRPTFGTTGFYFEREPWLFTGTNNFAYISGGMVKNVCLGNSESYGNQSYGLGYRGTVLGDKSATLAGDMNYVYGSNSVAIGGSNLVTTSGNQVVIGTYNDPNTNALFVVGSGASDTRRKNVFEVTGDGDTKQSRFSIKSFSLIAAAGSNQATATEITTDIVSITGGTGGVRLPATAGGHIIYVKNLYPSAPYSTVVYAPVGGTLRNFGASFTFSGEGLVLCTALSANCYDVY